MAIQKKKKKSKAVSKKPAKKKKKKKATKGEVQVSVPIKRIFPNGEKAVFSNHFAVRKEEGNYHLCFFDIVPPVVLAGEKSPIIQHVDATCVSRIIVTESLIPGIIKALGTHLETNKK